MAGPQSQGLERGRFDDKPARVLIVVAPYYRAVADALLRGAQAEVEAWGATWEVAEVPGALEIAPAIAMAARLGEFHAFVALGCVIRGETTHYDTVVEESAHGVTLLGLQGHCIGNGILTVETEEQARVRAEDQDKGGGAAAAALHLLQLSRRWTRAEKGLGFLQGRLGASQ
ncbi:6,7-dimethyl-8-ribityllumazine synthase [Rubellimicrobium aerolatum]|uniref:6,7-dimethyl-8-ribityllumazine synthase n=1 Tax=Rubellimicrobium aerolatum TaxID=490979 RepID=A0ABW0SCE5_9RHOB|nr:6,7-dimethyl-8-ribityllumazine synthase [Rubellimicrobium aerolatum]MBP1806267.1 6,7-dimethyl-8-ribityllumazine synthase [Rubellimicrobium aerolatum]